MKIIKEKISTNNFFINKDLNLTTLESKFKVLKYQLSESQNDYRRFADRKFYARFTNNYKENFDVPFYYHVYSGLYAVMPKENSVKKWHYKFNELEEIAVSEISFKELELHILMKLMVALFFYNESEHQRRVCQSQFFVLGKVKGNMPTALQFELKQISENDQSMEFNIKASAKNFIKKDRTKINPQYVAADSYFEQLVKEGVIYFRQLRPSKVLEFSGDLYSNNIPFKTDKAKLDWYSDSRYKESKSFYIHTFKERFKTFLAGVGIDLIEKQQEFIKLEKVENTSLPVDQLGIIKVFDNRLSRTIPIQRYVELFQSFSENSIQFEVTNDLQGEKNALVIHDCVANDFVKDEVFTGILSEGYTDPYKALYLKHPTTAKQSIIVNSHEGHTFNSATDYLNYEFIEDSEIPLYKTKLEVCLNELLLKSLLLGYHLPSDVLPFLSTFNEMFKWGFISDKVLMHFSNEKLVFADLSTKDGKEVLSSKFIRWSKILSVLKTRKPFFSEEELEEYISKSAFIVSGTNIIEIERLDEAVLPEISKIVERKADDPKKSVRTRDAITVYAGGVWFNEVDATYVVSGVHSMNWREPRAHHLYKIHLDQSDGSISLSMVLKLLCVKFVRNKQFTVYPYFFDLLRLNREMLGHNLIVD